MFTLLQTLAKHVMSIHMNAQQISNEPREGELDLRTLKKFIAFCRRFHIFFLSNIFNNFALSCVCDVIGYSKCGPRLSKSAAEKLQNRYVLMRNGAGAHERETGRRTSIPITVRQLEAIIRISESLAKMRLAAFATEADVDEALRLFQVSTLDAASTGNLAGACSLVIGCVV